ncbi:hypothetical protein BJ085DRAFT_29648 [Dimargaris cristalligena]|uniref:Uncharacterized protein n=1 Tax=Dimargaris cristalligena TaxID=215637 RepID=A0A4P9ZYG6_9FUNG|nr:hypothetical protein BJ085DRAFT_29648 [Dimargaris cristalligena]|eukprot:RKP38418.1 hypothetical protein BJ085DRAFT_29648 [Dimargaris cristalligena]
MKLHFIFISLLGLALVHCAVGHPLPENESRIAELESETQLTGALQGFNLPSEVINNILLSLDDIEMAEVPDRTDIIQALSAKNLPNELINLIISFLGDIERAEAADRAAILSALSARNLPTELITIIMGYRDEANHREPIIEQSAPTPSTE